jgi:hypothetical protein
LALRDAEFSIFERVFILCERCETFANFVFVVLKNHAAKSTATKSPEGDFRLPTMFPVVALRPLRRKTTILKSPKKAINDKILVGKAKFPAVLSGYLPFDSKFIFTGLLSDNRDVTSVFRFDGDKINSHFEIIYSFND